MIDQELNSFSHFFFCIVLDCLALVICDFYLLLALCCLFPIFYCVIWYIVCLTFSLKETHSRVDTHTSTKQTLPFQFDSIAALLYCHI